MKAMEVLLSRRWILKERDKELYYEIRDHIGLMRKFLTEKLGYQIIVNPYLVKIEKIPASPENWMGISAFNDTSEYVFFCMVLMFLEDKEAGEQFVLSALTEYIQAQYKEALIDWTLYHYRRHLVRVLKYCVEIGILNINDGSEESFAKNDSGEVLYENTGVSRYFMKNFTQDIMGYTSPRDFEKEEWIDIDEDRGIVRRQRVYRRLLMSMAIYRRAETEEDFAYVRNYRNMIQGDFAEFFDCELHVHRTSAFLVLSDGCRLGRCFPEEHTLSDIVLLLNGLLIEKIREGAVLVPDDEMVVISEEMYRRLIDECRERYSKGFNKTYREMTSGEFFREADRYMTELMLVERRDGHIVIYPAAGKIIGKYPKGFLENGGSDE